MTTTYFYHSPRGFSNEATVYAVHAENAIDWVSWFNSTQTDAYHEAYQITRRQAEKLIRRDGVGLGIDPNDIDPEVIRADRLTPATVAAATANAVAMMREWHTERDLDLEFAR